MIISFLILFVQEAYPSTIENTAGVLYSDGMGKETLQFSDKRVTLIQNPSDFSLKVSIPIPKKEGKKLENWIFPAIVTNSGNSVDKYKLIIEDLVSGLESSIYHDKNGNGLIDPEDPVITVTPLIKSKDSLPIIISIKDKTGQNPGSIKLSLVASSETISSVSAKSPFEIVVIEEVPVPVPTETPKPTPNPLPGEFSLGVKKTVFPDGKIKTGDILSYYIEVTNQNNTTVDNVIYLMDKLPTGLVVLSIDNVSPISSDNGELSYSLDGNDWTGKFSGCDESNISSCIKFLRVKWNKLEPNQTVNFYFKVRVSSNVNGTIENVAWAEVNLPGILIQKSIIKAVSNPVINVVEKTYYVGGTTYDKTGNIKEGTVVELYKDGKLAGSETTGKTGKFLIRVDDKGDYDVVYKTPDSSEIFQDKVSVVAEGTTLVPIHIWGKVLNSQTLEIILNAKLDLLDKDGNIIAKSTTDANGFYNFSKDGQNKNIRAGSYFIRITEANGFVTYVRSELKSEFGDAIFKENIYIDPLPIVYDEFSGLAYPIENASVRLLSECGNENSLVKLDDLDNSIEQKNAYLTLKDGRYYFVLNKEQLSNKTYCLSASAEGYQTKLYQLRFFPTKTYTVSASIPDEIPGRFNVEIVDTFGNKTLIKNVETLPFNIPLRPKKYIEINKKVNKPSIEIGEIVTYTLEIKNVMKSILKDGKIIDRLPFGFKYVEGTLSVNGQLVKDFKAVDVLNINLGEMKPEQKFTIVYQARTGIRVPGGAAVNKATISAVTTTTETLTAGPATATVLVKKGVFNTNGTIIGRVYIDKNNNGIPDDADSGLENIAIYTANGLRVLTDKNGKFSIPDVPNGDFIVHLDKTSLPENVYLSRDAYEIAEVTNKKISEITTQEIDLNNITSSPFYITSNTSVKIKLFKNNDLKAFIVFPNGKQIEVDDKTLVSYEQLELAEKINSFKLKLIDEKEQIIEQTNFKIQALTKFELPKNEIWIGEDSALRRVFITESGMGKANFRLIKFEPEKLKLPQISKKLNKIVRPLMGVYVYPAKFAVKEIKHVTYPDIQNHWSQKTVEYESGLDIIHGYPDGLFKPGRSITRSEATKLTLVALKSFDIKMGTTFGYILKNSSKVGIRLTDSNGKEIRNFYNDKNAESGINLIYWDGKDNDGKLVPLGKYTFEVNATDKSGNINTLRTTTEVVPSIPNFRPTGKASFKDLKEKHWSNSFVKSGTDEKLVKGYPDITFRADKFIPRYEMAVIAVHAMNLDIATGKDELPFKDEQEIPGWARKYVYLSYVNDLLPKFPDNKFRPNRPISRAEIALFVRNLIKKQKISTLLRGSVSQYLNKISIDGNLVEVLNQKDFELMADKKDLESFNISIPDFENLKTNFDDKYIDPLISSGLVKSETNIIPVPEEEKQLEPKTPETKKVAEETDKRASFISRFEINMNEESDKPLLFDIGTAAITFTSEIATNPDIMVNGIKVSEELIGKTQINNKTGQRTYTFYSVLLNDGDNEIVASSIDYFGNKRGKTYKRHIQVKGKPVRINIETVKIPADGKTIKDVTIEIFDEWGNPVVDDIFVTVRIEQGQIKTVDQDPNTQGLQFRTKDGKIIIQVIPPNEVQTVNITAETNMIKGTGFVDFTTPLREPIFIGMAKNNTGFSFKNGNTFNDDPKSRTGFSNNFGAALFTQGTIFNDYLLTLAFDTNKKLNALDDETDVLLRSRTEDRLYPTYGDASQLNQVVTANSNIFFKLEKSKSSLLWGDFSTSQKESDLTSPRLTNYNRVLTGGKLLLNMPMLPMLDVFAAMSNQLSERDEIRGAGVSGPYYTSKYPLVNGTERIIIETRDRVFTSKVLKTKTLNRLSDYNFDYSNGSIIFSQPVSSFDENLNPNYIIVVYEYYPIDFSGNIWGASLKQNLPFGTFVGGSYIKENSNVKPYQLWGLNIGQNIGDKFNLIGEYANSNFENKNGSSYRVAIEGKPTDNIKIQGEYQNIDENFSNKSGGSLIAGTERYSLKTGYKPFERTDINLEFNRDYNFKSKNLVQALNTTLTQDIYSHIFNMNLEGRNFTDSKNIGKTLWAGILGLGYRTPTFFNISLSIDRAQNLLTNSDPNKPTTTTVGIDYAITNNVKLYAKQNFFEKDKLTTATVVGVDTGFSNDSDFFNAVNVGAKYQIDGSMDGRSAQSKIGLNNKINVISDLSLGVAYERVMSEKTATKTMNLDEDHNAWSFSADYAPRNIPFKASAKYDFRDGTKNSNLINLNMGGAIGDDFGAFGKFSLTSSSDETRRALTEALIGMAYRPLKNDYFNALLKYQLKNKTEGIGQISDVMSHILSFEGYIQPFNSWEIFTKVAFKNSLDRTTGFNPVNSNISLGLARVTYKLNYYLDLVGEFRNLTQYETATSNNDFTAEIGYFPVKDLRIGAGYNLFGYNDKDLTTSNYSSQGPYINLTLKVGNLGSIWGQDGVVTKKGLLETDEK